MNVSPVSFDRKRVPQGLALVVAPNIRLHPKRLRQWVQAFGQAQFSYTNGWLTDAKQVTVHPTACSGLEWLMQQNPLGCAFLVAPGLLTAEDWAWANTQPTPAAWMHAIAMMAVSKAVPEGTFLFHPATYHTTLADEQAIYWPTDGLAERVSRCYPGAWLEEPQGVLRRRLSGRPMVSIMIPFRDRPELLSQCLDAILAYEDKYPAFEVIGINNQSTLEETFAVMRAYEARSSKIRFIEYPHPFNYSAMNNRAVQVARGELVLLLNNDIQVQTPDWLQRLAEWATHPKIGAVGAKLFYPTGQIQHAGVSIGILGSVLHSFKGLPRGQSDPWGWVNVHRNVSVVTGACLMMRRDLYLKMGGLNAELFQVAYNDVDLCLRLLDGGYRNLLVSSAEAIHHESVSRGKDMTPLDRQENAALKQLHHARLFQLDPYFSGALSHFSEMDSTVQGQYLAELPTERLVSTKVPLVNKRWHLYRFANGRLFSKILAGPVSDD